MVLLFLVIFFLILEDLLFIYIFFSTRVQKIQGLKSLSSTFSLRTHTALSESIEYLLFIAGALSGCCIALLSFLSISIRDSLKYPTRVHVILDWLINSCTASSYDRLAL